MKKYFLALLSVIVLLFTACDSWMQDDDFYSEIENDVKVANAQQINVYVRYALTRQGKTDPDGYATFKVEIPHEISATTEPEYGFVRWAAFPTSFLATGDNQAKNKDVYFIDDEDYKTRLLPYEIQSPVVVFENDKSATTKVTINEKRDDIFLVPIVAQRPAVSLTIPAKGSSGVVRNMSVRINFTKPMDPESFKNEAGEYDKITITQGIQTFSTDGDIEITSEDITDRFQEPLFSANKKMVTLRFTQEAISEGYSSQSSVNIIISKDVKDVFGFNMTDDDKISFSVGSSMDTLAPRITRLTAGTALTNFDSFKGMYKDAATWNLISAVTQMESWQQGSGTNATYLGASSAPANNLDSSFYDTFAPPADASNSGYRVTNKLYIHALAEDIAGSGSNQSQTGIETDVAMLGVRATLMYAADGSVPETPVTLPTSSVNYMPQSVGQSLAKDYVYKNLVHAINVQNGAPNASDPGFIAEDKGFLFEYDLSSLPDGLIRVDVFAVDMVQNSGLSAGGELSEEYGNGYASLFVVKDTTPPDAAVNAGHVNVDTSASTLITADNYFNEKTYKNLRIKSDESSIIDSGHPRLRSHHDAMKWIVKPTESTDWVSTVKTSDSAWGAITANYGPFPNPGNEGQVHYTYALMDDVGNISAAVGINPIYYDSVAPAVGQLAFKADAGYTDGVAKDNILDEQTLIIPIKEITSGLKSIEVKVRKNGAAEDYATPLANSGLVVTTGGEAVPYTIDSGKKIITFSQPQTNFDSTVSIKGLKLSDNLDEQGSFEVSVLVKDAAAADSVHETLPAEAAVSNTDSVPVQINTIYIPNIRATERLGAAGFEYWIDYNASTLTKKANSNPLTDVFITFKEATSGAKVFDFTNSTISLTGDSMIYKVNASTGAIDGIAIPSTVSGNKLTITSSVDAKNNFANPSDENKVTVKITNVELEDEGYDSSVDLKIYDTATNPSAAGKTICSNEGSLNLINPGISTAGFKFDSAAPTAQKATGETTIMKDRAARYTELPDFLAEDGYTNEVYVNAKVSLNNATSSTSSGIYSLTIEGDAVFETGITTFEIPVSNGTSTISYDVSNSGKTATFKNANGHLMLGGARLITINNLKLTSGDGDKTVTIKATSFGGVQSITNATETIILDTKDPEWNDQAGSGLYVATNSAVTAGRVYPHPLSDSKVYGLTNIDTAKPNDIYFYCDTANTSISIMPDVLDDNKKDATQLISYTKGETVLTNSTAYFLRSDYGTFTATARDKAGNKSVAKTFHIVSDTSFASDEDCSKIDQYMVLYKPAGAFIHRNTADNSILKYVIKQDAQYEIRVKLGGNAPVTGEEAINGGTPVYTSGTIYNRKDNTTDSSRIEKYYISTSSSAPSNSSSYWKEYTSGASNTFVSGTVSTSIDSDGTIKICLPQDNCSPLVLHLLDGCGNSVSRNIRPVSSSDYVTWAVDSEVGAIENETNYKGTPTYTGSYTSDTDVSFYKGSVTLKINTLTESCRFPSYNPNDLNEPKFISYSNDSSFKYTLKSRIIAWTGTGSPERDDFGSNDGSKPATTPAASDWCFVQQAADGDSPVFYVQNNFPEYSSTERYKLYIILEDTVGNFVIKQIKRASNGNAIVSPDKTDTSVSGIEYWLYDNTAPAVDESSIEFHKVNKITLGSGNSAVTYNYFSDNSYVTYDITDAGSGIWNPGDGNITYPGFDSTSRKTEIKPKKYSLSGRVSSSYDNISGDHDATLKISGIKDYAGNPLGDITLKNGNVEKWRWQSKAPTLASNSTAELTSLLGAVNPTFKDNDEKFPNSERLVGGKVLSIKAKSRTTRLDVKLYVTDTTPLLGWYISDTPLDNFETKDFYTAAELTANNTAQNITVTHNSDGAYVIDYNKGLGNYVAWHEHDTFKVPKYYYPVNRAGSIATTPIKVVFTPNYQPVVVGGNSGFTYSSNNPIDSTYRSKDAPEAPYTIKTSVNTDASSETPKINYTREGATVTFATDYNPDKCKIIYEIQKGNDNQLGTDDDVYVGEEIDLTGSGPYTISLVSDILQTKTASASGTPLKLQLSRGTEEDSIVYELKGPAGNNLWVYDNTDPEVSFDVSDDTEDIKSGSSTASKAKKSVVTSDDTRYIQNENAFIAFTLRNADDIAHFQWKKRTDFSSDTKWSGWTDITSGRDGGNLTFTAPAEKTEYRFRAIDTAGNISEATSIVKLQRDDKAPTGTFKYETRKGTVSTSTSSDKKDLTDNGLGNGEGVDNPYGGNAKIRDISYSNSESSTKYYINHIWVDLSKITDKISNIERSGIQYFTIKKDGVSITTNPLPADTGSYKIDLTGNDENKVYVYEVCVTDNIGQEETLQTFRTNVDGTAPALSGISIQAKASNGSNESDAVQYPEDTGTYYLKNTIAHITFNISDAFAKYEWSTTGNANDWHDSEHSTIEANSTSVIWTFDAPDEETTYYFRGTDRVGNCSATDTTPPISIKIQKDMWAPTGSATKTLKKGDTTVTLSTGLVTTSGSGETAVEDIKYSSNSSAGSANYINKFIINLSSSDDVDNKSRSGVKEYQIWKKVGDTEESKVKTLGASTESYEIDLSTGHTEGTTYSYKVKVIDNIGQERVLKTFKLTSDGTAPRLNFYSMGAKAASATGQAVYVEDKDTWFLTQTTAVIKFSVDNYETTTYLLSPDNGTSWITIPDDNGTYSVSKSESGSNTLITINFDTPVTPTTYKFKAIDEVGNVKTLDTSYKLAKDYSNPIGPISFKFTDGSSEVDSKYYSYSTRQFENGTYDCFVYNSTKITSMEFDFHEIKDDDSGIEGFYIHENGNEERITLTEDKHYIYTFNLSDGEMVECYFSVKDNAGHERWFSDYNYIFIADGSKPVIALESIEARPQTVTELEQPYTLSPFGSGESTVYYLKYDRAIVKLSSSTQTDICKYEIQDIEGNWIEKNIGEDVTSVLVELRYYTPNNPGIITIHAVDEVGNTSNDVSFNFQIDTENPRGIVDLKVKYEDEIARHTAYDGPGAYYRIQKDNYIWPYFSEQSGFLIDTYIFNPEKVDKIVFSGAEDEENGSGFAGYYKRTENQPDVKIENDYIELTEDTYEKFILVTKDNAGNESGYIIIELKPFKHTKAFVKETNNPAYSGLPYVPTYPYVSGADANNESNSSKWIKGFDTDDKYTMSPDAGTITEGTVNIWTYQNGKPKQNKESVGNYTIRKFSDTTNFTIPIDTDSLPPEFYSMWCGITYNSIVEPTSWELCQEHERMEQFGKIEDLLIDLTKVTTRHTFIFIWLKDALGNVEVYNLTYPNGTGQNWWTTEASKSEEGNVADFDNFEYAATAGANGNINTIGGNGINDGGKRGNRISDSETSNSRVTQLFNSMANVFARNSEVTADTSVTEKPADVAKKAAKKAKKTAKKAGKKASGKAVAAEKPLMAVETAEILEQTLTTSAPEITGATESVVNEIAQITENVQGQSEVITRLAPAASADTEAQVENQTVAEAETDAGGKKSSKSSIIVIMLAILSSFGGVWYYQKGRKL